MSENLKPWEIVPEKYEMMTEVYNHYLKYLTFSDMANKLTGKEMSELALTMEMAYFKGLENSKKSVKLEFDYEETVNKFERIAKELREREAKEEEYQKRSN